MNEHRTPDELTAENELICEKLLGWKKFADPINGVWWGHDGVMEFEVPSFTTWAEAGLILEAFETRSYDFDIDSTETETGYKRTVIVYWCGDKRVIRFAGSAPLAIRAAALECIRSLP